MSEANMLAAIQPKSDQLNSDDLIGDRTLTVKITKVSGCEGDQKIAINFEGDGDKPYKPGKSMCRVLVSVWGATGSDYVGRSMTLYRDGKVQFGGIEVGGIRISHMSHMTEPMVIALTNKKGSRKAFTVRPLIIDTVLADAPKLEDYISDIETAATVEALKFKHDAAVRTFKDDDSRKKIVAAKEKRKIELTKKEDIICTAT